MPFFYLILSSFKYLFLAFIKPFCFLNHYFYIPFFSFSFVLCNFVIFVSLIVDSSTLYVKSLSYNRGLLGSLNEAKLYRRPYILLYNNHFRNSLSYDMWLIHWLCIMPLSLIFQLHVMYIMATSFSGGRSWSTRREPPTISKQLVNFITCGCESSAPFL